MEHIPGYQSLEMIAHYRYSILYKGFSTKMRQDVFLKIMKNHSGNELHTKLLKKEFQFVEKLAMDEKLFPLYVDEVENVQLFIYRYVPFITLHDYLQEKGVLLLDDFFPIAINLATAFVELHHHQIIHRNINPSTILLNPLTNEIKLTGFHYANKWSNHSSNENALESEIELPYISPEQSGRMNQKVQVQSDLYSLGMIFYQMLTGTLPFQENTPIDWYHAHITKQPKTIIEENIDIPMNLSMMVMKLLNKSINERYNSSFGLREDFLLCFKLYQESLPIQFEIGKKDPFMTIEATNQLFGREKEFIKIGEVWEHLKTGHSQFMLISGDSGTGKTSIVEEVKHRQIMKGSFYIEGKYEMYNQRPYSAILDAFQMALRKILTLDEETINTWSKRIKKEIGTNLSVIYKVLPELQWIVKEQLIVLDFNTADVQSHFFYVFQKLIRIFAMKEHPLVLFLDDLQWADRASLELIEYVLSNHDTKYFMLIATYRKDEVGEEHFLYQKIEKLKQERIVHTIVLDVLALSTIKMWLSNYLRDSKLINEFSRTIYQISQGNPFFIKQLLFSFYENKVLFFDTKNGTWDLDDSGLTETILQDNVVSFIINRLNTLKLKTKEFLQIASCLGNQFDIQLLFRILKIDYEHGNDILLQVIDMGLILPFKKNGKGSIEANKTHEVYRFIHDRVQQAVYSTLTSEHKASTHLKIGEYLLNHDLDNHNDAQLLVVVHHLNLGVYNQHEEDTLIRLAKLNIDAGKYAKSTGAFQAALSYFMKAYQLMGEQWEKNNQLTFSMLLELGETQYLNSYFEEAEAIFNRLLNKTKSKVQKLTIYQMKLTMFTHMHRVDEAVEAGLAALELFNQRFPANPSKFHVARELAQLKLAMIGKQPRMMLKLPEMEKAENRYILKILISLNAPTFHVNQNLSTIFMLKAMRMTIKYGLTENSPLVFNNYALILSAGFNQYKQSYEYGNLALSHAKELGINQIKGRVHFVLGSFVNHWKNHIKYSIEHFDKAQQLCIQSGNIHIAGATSSFIMIAHFIKGTTFDEMQAKLKTQKTFLEEIQYPLMVGFMSEMEHWFQYVANQKGFDWTFELVMNDDSGKIVHYTIRLIMAYLFQQKDYAKRVLHELEPLVNNRLTLIIAPEYYFYRSLWLLNFLQNDDVLSYQKREMIKKVKHDLRKLTTFAKLSPENYDAKKWLVEAELNVLLGNKASAETYYEKAIQSSTQNQFVHITALCNELAGNFFERQGKMNMAGSYFYDAFEGYKAWGAVKKAELLIQQHRVSLNRFDKGLTFTNTQSRQDYDLNVVYKATQLISKEMNIDLLVQKILDMTMKNAGATKGLLLVKEDEHFNVAASRHTKTMIDDQTNHYSTAIVNYVNRTGESVFIDDTQVTGIFFDDEQLKKTGVKSICCLPIIFSNMIKGILYLENDQSTYAFTKERMRFLTLISTQAAISIENAQLYKRLEDKVKERTVELEQANLNLEKVNNELAEAEEMRGRLLSNISHDLRAPIASVQGYMEAILDGFADTEEKRNDYIRNSIARIKGLHMLINDLFDLIQLESGQLFFAYDYIPIDQLLLSVHDRFKFEIENKRLDFQILLPKNDGIFPLVEIDTERMHQVFTNIITNAMKHTLTGGIYLEMEIDNHNVLISIRDTGVGIDKDDIPYIFERNYTKSRIDSKKGNGLGLTICREIIKHHKGEIWTESKVGEGTTIFLLLPTVKVEEDVLQ